MDPNPAGTSGTAAEATRPGLIDAPGRRRRVGPVTVTLALLVALLIAVNLTIDDARRTGALLPQTASGPRPARSTATPLDVIESAAAARQSSSSTTTSTTKPPAATPVVTPPPVDSVLHRPERVPEQWERRPITVVGRIAIPKIGLDLELRNQITQESIDQGPSHWPGTAMPGAEGNAVIAGHRSSYSAPFRDLGNLRAGDTITLTDSYGRSFTYAVTEMFVVYPDAMWIRDQEPGRTLTLFTCHPIGSAAQRLVVKATLVA